MTARPQPAVGIGLMLAAMAILPYLDVCAKLLGRQGVPVLEIVWARMFFGFLFTVPFAIRDSGIRALVPADTKLHAGRASLIIAATGFFFLALRYLSIADTLAIFFVQPLIVTSLSPLVLGEHVGWRRWLAVSVGFAGTLIIIRPGFRTFSSGMLFALVAGFSLALYMLITRRISGRTPALITTLRTNMAGAAITCLILPFTWVTPHLAQWGLFLLLAFIAGFGHFLIVRAYDHAEASLLAPLAYAEMIMATAAGWWFFGDFPDRWTFVGVGILIVSAVYISIRERGRGAREFEQP
jgi:drug/metabolite transporter (DMT)-like permease